MWKLLSFAESKYYIPNYSTLTYAFKLNKKPKMYVSNDDINCSWNFWHVQPGKGILLISDACGHFESPIFEFLVGNLDELL